MLRNADVHRTSRDVRELDDEGRYRLTYIIRSDTTDAQTRSDILDELRKWKHDGSLNGEENVIGERDFPAPEKVGGVEAVFRFELRGTRIDVTSAQQPTYRQNMRCVYFAIKAMRMNEKRGIADTIRKAYLQIEAPAAGEDPYEVLEIRPTASSAMVEAAHRTLAKTAHPDKGGSDAAMKRISDARDRILDERKPA